MASLAESAVNASSASDSGKPDLADDGGLDPMDDMGSSSEFLESLVEGESDTDEAASA